MAALTAACAGVAACADDGFDALPKRRLVVVVAVRQVAVKVYVPVQKRQRRRGSTASVRPGGCASSATTGGKCVGVHTSAATSSTVASASWNVAAGADGDNYIERDCGIGVITEMRLRGASNTAISWLSFCSIGVGVWV